MFSKSDTHTYTSDVIVDNNDNITMGCIQDKTEVG